MEQLNLEVTQTLLRDRHAQVVRDAETRRMLRERAALGRTDTATAADAPATEPARRGPLAWLAELRRPARRRPAVS